MIGCNLTIWTSEKETPVSFRRKETQEPFPQSCMEGKQAKRISAEGRAERVMPRCGLSRSAGLGNEHTERIRTTRTGLLKPRWIKEQNNDWKIPSNQ